MQRYARMGCNLCIAIDFYTGKYDHTFCKPVGEKKELDKKVCFKCSVNDFVIIPVKREYSFLAKQPITAGIEIPFLYKKYFQTRGKRVKVWNKANHLYVLMSFLMYDYFMFITCTDKMDVIDPYIWRSFKICTTSLRYFKFGVKSPFLKILSTKLI